MNDVCRTRAEVEVLREGSSGANDPAANDRASRMKDDDDDDGDDDDGDGDDGDGDGDDDDGDGDDDDGDGDLGA
jgi:hypothetical protein